MIVLIISFNFLFLWNECICVPARPSSWHGRLSTNTNARPVAACGDDTTVEFNPWAAILYFNDELRCGATILGHQLAVTAAHCVIGKPTHRLLLYYGRSLLPDNRLGQEDEIYRKYGGKSRILAVKNHPQYSLLDQCEGYDIAVLKLETYIPYSDFVRPIKVVPTEPKYQIMFRDGAKVRIAGFGQFSGPPDSSDADDYPEVMQLLENRIVPQQTCNRGNSTLHFGPPRDGICTRGRCRQPDQNQNSKFKQICTGDSGSGVVQFFAEDNEFYLIAIVSCSFAPNGEDCGHSKTPSLSINVRYYRTFIYDTFNLEETSPTLSNSTNENVDTDQAIGLRIALEETIRNCDEYKESHGYLCVPYYQCRDGAIITDGAGLIDIRNGFGALNAEDGKCPGFLDVCCKDPDHTPPKPTETSYNHKCGRRNTNGIEVVIRGFTNGESQFGDWPNMVAVLGPTEQFVCGGSLIAPGAVLTAAHCVNKYRNTPNKLKVRAGEWDSQRDTEPYPHQDRNVVAVRVHPEFHEDALWNNFAILFTNTNFNLAPHVDTTCLPIQGSGDEFDGTSCFVTGWGKDKFGREGELQTVLKEIDLPIVNYDDCQSTLQTTKLGSKFKLHISFICAGGEKGKDTCEGDGGSPLLCPSKHDPNTYVQVGIVAWGIGCGENGVPGVYADVSTAVCWIDYEMSGYYGQQTGNFSSYFGYGRTCGRWLENIRSELNDKYTSLEGRSGRVNQREREKFRKVLDAYSRYNVQWI